MCTAKFHKLRRRLLVGDKGGNVLQAAKGHSCIVTELGVICHENDTGRVRNNTALDFCFEKCRVAHAGFDGHACGTQKPW